MSANQYTDTFRCLFIPEEYSREKKCSTIFKKIQKKDVFFLRDHLQENLQVNNNTEDLTIIEGFSIQMLVAV